MSSSLTNSAALADNPAFQAQVRAAMVEAAWNIINEATTVADHVSRVALAKKVVQNPNAYVGLFTFSAANNVTISTALNVAAVADTDLRTVMGQLWTMVAGQFT